MKLQWEIFIAFFRVGIFGYGGGPASIPLVQKEVVERFRWMNNEEFGDILAIGNTLPGPIATKMAGYIGYRVGGYLGMLTALIASIVPTIILMIVFLTSLSAYKDQAWVQGMTHGVLPVVGVMMAVLTWQFFDKGKEGLGWWKTSALVILSLVVIEFLGIHPGIVIAILLTYALVGRKNATSDKEADSS
ncbi:chromate transporter [Alkalihalophilus pseudofirmus]|uniref:chromate transporter n=1 Tax=Alkalihalobacterium alkalinitrilicum TaxID=427920 RepID=UPI00094D9C4B|nr:chromate transporter [Alkalihalobacterium alkalinitrilicum]OLO28217.1 chromate transporter [Alkalihalophilus pseudofirmus]